MNQIKLGIDVFLDASVQELAKARLGILVNQASVTSGYRYTHIELMKQYGSQVVALFAPQHGLWGEQQANMIETPHSFYNGLRIPIHSLYSETREPTAEMLENIDCLIVDLQDVGTRVYTYIWTVLNCLKACAERGIQVIILDRPNPVGGVAMEGPCLDINYKSFVGMWTIPMRHGLTFAELIKLLIQEMSLDVDCSIYPMQGWKREHLFSSLGLHWILPSPNLPTFHSVLTYPGQVLLEGTNISEGRGTTTPFEVLGAPFINADALWAFVNQFSLPGVIFLPTKFLPTFDKWKNQSCEGVRMIITDPQLYDAYRTTVTLLRSIITLWPESFVFNPPPYEYEHTKMPIDILSGNPVLRQVLTNGALSHQEAIEQAVRTDKDSWYQRIENIKLY